MDAGARQGWRPIMLQTQDAQGVGVPIADAVDSRPVGQFPPLSSPSASPVQAASNGEGSLGASGSAARIVGHDPLVRSQLQAGKPHKKPRAAKIASIPWTEADDKRLALLVQRTVRLSKPPPGLTHGRQVV